MKELYQLTAEERELYFRAASNVMKVPYEIIEKDYWVVWILERLFSLDTLRPHLTFKGGTSLSKIFGIIDRFSEDIDLSIEKEMFGFVHSSDPEKAPSRKKQQSILDSISQHCSSYVQSAMQADLQSAIHAKLETDKGWELYLDQEDPDLQTLLFRYPSANKISLGAYSQATRKN
jgi:predicted nucleotidyltransferase component of viral defense system